MQKDAVERHRPHDSVIATILVNYVKERLIVERLTPDDPNYEDQISRLMQLDIYEKLVETDNLSSPELLHNPYVYPSFSPYWSSQGVVLSQNCLTSFADPLGYRICCSDTFIPSGTPYYFEFYPFVVDVEEPLTYERAFNQEATTMLASLNRIVEKRREHLAKTGAALGIPFEDLVTSVPGLGRAPLTPPNLNREETQLPLDLDFRRKCVCDLQSRGPGYSPSWRLGIRRVDQKRETPYSLDVPLGWDDSGIALRSIDGSICHTGVRRQEGDFADRYSPLVIESLANGVFGAGDVVGVLVYFEDDLELVIPSENPWQIKDEEETRNMNRQAQDAEAAALDQLTRGWTPSDATRNIWSEHLEDLGLTHDNLMQISQQDRFDALDRITQKGVLSRHASVSFFVNGKRVKTVRNLPYGFYVPAVSSYSPSAGVTVFFGSTESRNKQARVSGFDAFPSSREFPKEINISRIMTLLGPARAQAERLLIQTRLSSIGEATCHSLAKSIRTTISDLDGIPLEQFVDDLLKWDATIKILRQFGKEKSHLPQITDHIIKILDIDAILFRRGDVSVSAIISEQAMEIVEKMLLNLIDVGTRSRPAGSARGPPQQNSLHPAAFSQRDKSHMLRLHTPPKGRPPGLIQGSPQITLTTDQRHGFSFSSTSRIRSGQATVLNITSRIAPNSHMGSLVYQRSDLSRAVTRSAIATNIAMASNPHAPPKLEDILEADYAPPVFQNSMRSFFQQSGSPQVCVVYGSSGFAGKEFSSIMAAICGYIPKELPIAFLSIPCQRFASEFRSFITKCSANSAQIKVTNYGGDTPGFTPKDVPQSGPVALIVDWLPLRGSYPADNIIIGSFLDEISRLPDKLKVVLLTDPSDPLGRALRKWIPTHQIHITHIRRGNAKKLQRFAATVFGDGPMTATLATSLCSDMNDAPILQLYQTASLMTVAPLSTEFCTSEIPSSGFDVLRRCFWAPVDNSVRRHDIVELTRYMSDYTGMETIRNSLPNSVAGLGEDTNLLTQSHTQRMVLQCYADVLDQMSCAVSAPFSWSSEQSDSLVQHMWSAVASSLVTLRDVERSIQCAGAGKRSKSSLESAQQLILSPQRTEIVLLSDAMKDGYEIPAYSGTAVDCLLSTCASLSVPPTRSLLTPLDLTRPIMVIDDDSDMEIGLIVSRSELEALRAVSQLPPPVFPPPPLASFSDLPPPRDSTQPPMPLPQETKPQVKMPVPVPPPKVPSPRVPLPPRPQESPSLPPPPSFPTQQTQEQSGIPPPQVKSPSFGTCSSLPPSPSLPPEPQKSILLQPGWRPPSVPSLPLPPPLLSSTTVSPSQPPISLSLPPGELPPPCSQQLDSIPSVPVPPSTNTVELPERPPSAPPSDSVQCIFTGGRNTNNLQVLPPRLPPPLPPGMSMLPPFKIPVPMTLPQKNSVQLPPPPLPKGYKIPMPPLPNKVSLI